MLIISSARTYNINPSINTATAERVNVVHRQILCVKMLSAVRADLTVSSEYLGAAQCWLAIVENGRRFTASRGDDGVKSDLGHRIARTIKAAMEDAKGFAHSPQDIILGIVGNRLLWGDPTVWNASSIKFQHIVRHNTILLSALARIVDNSKEKSCFGVPGRSQTGT